jgi:hypothetical protein
MKKLLPIFVVLLILSGCSLLSTPSQGNNNGIDFLDTRWEDLSVFQDGLIESQQAVLDDLRGAPVYHIDLSIDNKIIKLTGEQVVRFTNQEEVALEEILFHLYPNILGGSLSVSNLKVDGEPISPSYGLSGSLMRVPLADPLPPGGIITIQMDFAGSVPTEIETNYGIYAYTDRILALAHFFPVLSVYDGDGWSEAAPNPQGDLTYADASFYLVRVTAPKNLVLVTSGNQIFTEIEGSQQVATFAAGPVRDFYLAASKDFRKQSTTVGEVTLNSYAPKKFQSGAEFALDVTENALQYFNTHYAPYPYTEYDIVPIPTLAYGIEYPGITAMAIRIYDLDADRNGTPNSVYLESTLVHEFGHQYFYNQVGSDQLVEPWLDESLVQYVTWMYFKDRYGSDGYSGFGGSLEERWNRVEMEEVPIGLPVVAYEGREYGAIVYGRGAFFFDELNTLMGAETFDEFIQDYIETYSWSNANGDDFKTLAEVHCRCDLTPLFQEWVYPLE